MFGKQKKEIVVKMVEVYGNEMIYPVCEEAKLLAQLAGTKTLTWRAIGIIKDMGYTVHVEVKAQPLTL